MYPEEKSTYVSREYLTGLPVFENRPYPISSGCAEGVGYIKLARTETPIAARHATSASECIFSCSSQCRGCIHKRGRNGLHPRASWILELRRALMQGISIIRHIKH